MYFSRMLSPFRELKLTYLFKILDFDHDGVLQESDFKGLGENIGIFRCLPPDSEIEKFIMKRSKGTVTSGGIFIGSGRTKPSSRIFSSGDITLPFVW